MTHLVPQQRLDKNGKLTTRHVRSDAQSPAASTSFPSPAVAPVTPVHTPREAATAAWKRLESAGLKYSSAVIPNLEYVAEHDGELLDRVVDRYTQGADTSERAMWQGMISFTGLFPSGTESGMVTDPPEKYLSNYRRGLEFFPFVSRLYPTVEGRTQDHYHHVAFCFNIASSSVPETLSPTDHDAIKAVLLVMRVEELRGAANWDDDHTVSNVDHKHDDIEYLAKNMKRVEPVLEGLLEMQATDPEVVETLSNTQSSLRDGAL